MSAKNTQAAQRRAARKAAKATPQDIFAERPMETAEEFARRRYERRRAEREAYWASKTSDDVEAMALEQSERESGGVGGEWFLPLLLDAVPRWATRHYATEPEARERRAHELGFEILAVSQGAAALADPAAVGTSEGDIAKAFNAIAEGLAIGAYCPGGTMPVAGVKWEIVGDELRVTNGRFCARHPVNIPDYWDTAPCAHLVEFARCAVEAAG